MTEPRDNLDGWLDTEVDPLRPPPGTFELIRKRARRRKARRALMSAASAGAAAAVIVVGVVALPRVVPSVLHVNSNPAGHSAAAGATASERSGTLITGKATAGPSANAAKHASQPVVPLDFSASSVTFVSLETGWVIGQAATAGRCSRQECTFIGRTDNEGKSWYGVPATLPAPADGANGVSQIRFLNTMDGWAFGPELFATHDGGHTWAQVDTPDGMRVTSLETVGSEAFAVFAKCTGTGADFAADCTQFFLYSSPAASNDWTPVPGLAGGFSLNGTASSATIVLTNGEGYLYTPDGTLLSGPVTGAGTWQAVSPSALRCLPGAAEQDGQPSSGQLAASAPGDLALACPGSSQPGGGKQEIIYASSDGGVTWKEQGSLTIAGEVTSLAAATGGELALAWTQGIYNSSDNGAVWHVTLGGIGFSYVGLTSPRQGVAVPSGPAPGELWFTYDAGLNWQARPIING